MKNLTIYAKAKFKTESKKETIQIIATLTKSVNDSPEEERTNVAFLNLYFIEQLLKETTLKISKSLLM